jgi:hypothetical protein
MYELIARGAAPEGCPSLGPFSCEYKYPPEVASAYSLTPASTQVVLLSCP